MSRSSGRTLALASLLSAVAAAVVSEHALAAPAFVVKIDKKVELASKPKNVTVSGVVDCPSGHILRLSASIVQKSSGAFAQAPYPAGRTRVTCTGGDSGWTVTATSKRQRFEIGAAEVCVIGTTQTRSGVTGLVSACKDVKIAAAK